MVNSLLMRMHLSGEITELSEEEFDVVKRGVSCYKETRNYIRMLTPFYPLSLPEYNDKLFCCGLKNNENVFLKIWRRDSDENKLTIPIPGLKNVKILFSDGRCDFEVNNNSISVYFNENKSAILIKADV